MAGQVLRGAGKDRRGHRSFTRAFLEQTDPQLRPLQRFVGYFHIVALAKRKENAPWRPTRPPAGCEKYTRREERLSQEGLGVLLELAKNIDAQVKPGNQQERAPAGIKTDRRRGVSGRPLHLALQERRPGPAQEVQANRGRPGRGAGPAELSTTP